MQALSYQPDSSGRKPIAYHNLTDICLVQITNKKFIHVCMVRKLVIQTYVSCGKLKSFFKITTFLNMSEFSSLFSGAGYKLYIYLFVF